MSDEPEIEIGGFHSDPEPVAPAAPPPVLDIAEQRRQNMAKARATMIANRAARKALPRTAVDTKRVGVGADPGPAARAEPAREVSMPEVVTRRKREDRAIGGLDVPRHLKKPGWDYEYKTIRVLNQPVDPSEIMDAREAGWRPEKAGDWPDLVLPGTAPDAPVERQGQRLYGRPMSLTMEAKQEDHEYAQRQQRDRMVAASTGKSAIRGEEGMPAGRGTRVVPGEVSIEGLAGTR